MSGIHEAMLRESGPSNLGPQESPQVIKPCEALERVLNCLCGLVAHLTHSPTVVVAQRCPTQQVIVVRGRFGTLIREVDMTFVLPDLNADRRPVLAIQDLRADPRFASHPLLGLMPHAKSMIAMLIPRIDYQSRAVLKIFNPKRSVFANGEVWQTLSEVCEVLSDVLSVAASPQNMTGAHQLPGGLADALPITPALSPAEAMPTTRFLLDTLVKKRTLQSRNGTDYLTLRSWRKPIKSFQLEALVALKRSKPDHLIAAAAAEIVASVHRVHGAGVIASVVPVPGGSSDDPSAFSVLLGRKVAELLGVPCSEVLAPQGKPGASSPRKSAALKPYVLTGDPQGPVLLVDDVATSGRHLELAVAALKSAARAIYAVAWIGR